MNKSSKIQSIELTGNKKEKYTYILKFNSSKTIEELIELYKEKGLCLTEKSAFQNSPLFLQYNTECENNSSINS